MKNKILIGLLFTLISGWINAQKPTESYVVSHIEMIAKFNYKPIDIKQIKKVDNIKNAVFSYIIIRWKDYQHPGYGRIILSNQTELNEFTEDLKLLLIKLQNNEGHVIRKKYIITCQDVLKYGLIKDKVIKKICFHEAGNSKSFVVLESDEVSSILNYLTYITL